MEFSKLIDKRRSAGNFIEGVKLTAADLKPVFDEVKLAPSAFNLQHTEYVVVLDEEKKKKFVKQLTGNIKYIQLLVSLSSQRIAMLINKLHASIKEWCI